MDLQSALKTAKFAPSSPASQKDLLLEELSLGEDLSIPAKEEDFQPFVMEQAIYFLLIFGSAKAATCAIERQINAYGAREPFIERIDAEILLAAANHPKGEKHVRKLYTKLCAHGLLGNEGGRSPINECHAMRLAIISGLARKMWARKRS